MARDPKQPGSSRPQRRRCTAKRSDGSPCGGWAIKGALVCRTHGGSAPQVRRKAAERVAEEEAREVLARYRAGAGPVADALGELLRLGGEVVAFKDYLAERVEQLRAEEWRYEDAKRSEQLRAEVALYERALDRTSKVLGDLARLNLEERQVRLAERQGELLAQVIRGVLDELELSAEQRARVPEVVPRHLRAVSEAAAG